MTTMAAKKSGGNDDLKAKFREALERKKSADHDHPHDEAAGTGPSHEDAAKTQRMFRRKSG
ncbi:hypothetical protein DY240_09985 [Jiangella rhizosphaerae]|uniref:DUF5302 domain-containing protein n=2 Tax=Jiangella rhizosphaerae TaxID=2293569 RepID=A0A418KST1_9ACTN|nr:hypothetical protein DY240_09985 [Jiangella rhizosphaerae]